MKEKEIFCKRDEYLKNHKDKLRKNIFAIEKDQESRIKVMMEERKKEIISSLMGKLNFL